MTRVSAGLGSAAINQPFSGASEAINDIDLGTFLRLMIAELQNQDPLNPLDNKDMLAQISQIREVGATDQLTATLEGVLLGQNISSATNLIGADIDAVSDDNQRVSGIVTRISIEGNEPKLHLDLASGGEPSIEPGDMEKGVYSYRVVWEGANGLEGIELSGAHAVSTLSSLNDYESVRLRNLPVTAGPKRIYRTDKTGTGTYRLVGTITDGSQSRYLDTLADEARSETRQTEPFRQEAGFFLRSFRVSLKNVAEIRPPGLAE
jgi:flagellar basal-body rod modification protein FlgD